jgi:hypothetical protein
MDSLAKSVGCDKNWKRHCSCKRGFSYDENVTCIDREKKFYAIDTWSFNFCRQVVADSVSVSLARWASPKQEVAPLPGMEILSDFSQCKADGVER